ELARDAGARARVLPGPRAAAVTSANELIVVHVSAGNPFRRWPESAFATLVAGLASGSPARRGVLISGPSDREAAVRIGQTARQMLGPAADRVLDIGEFDLAEL